MEKSNRLGKGQCFSVLYFHVLLLSPAHTFVWSQLFKYRIPFVQTFKMCWIKLSSFSPPPHSPEKGTRNGAHRKWSWLSSPPSCVLLWRHSYLFESCTVTLSWPCMGALVMVACSFYHYYVRVPPVALCQVEAPHAMAVQCQYGACGFQKASVRSLSAARLWNG